MPPCRWELRCLLDIIFFGGSKYASFSSFEMQFTLASRNARSCSPKLSDYNSGTMECERIRNFSIIAHIDHGKSTLADRILEITEAVEKRKMREQVLDQMDLERERGITIQMQPVHMEWRGHILNLIDTPGHIDFSYEVSRALCAVEGAILLVDATQGVQAQTLSVLNMAREQGLVLLPVVNKIDLPHAETNRTKDEIVRLLGCPRENILAVSSKTGEGVEKLLEEVIARFPPPESLGCPTPKSKAGFLQALVFDFKYDTHKGIILFLRII